MNLRGMAKDGLLKLPVSWGGSFSGADEFYNGDESSLEFLQADSGRSESDVRKIILTCRFKNNTVTARIRNLASSVDKAELIELLNMHRGLSLAGLYTLPLLKAEQKQHGV